VGKRHIVFPFILLSPALPTIFLSMKKWQKALTFSVLALLVVVAFGLAIASDAGLMLFDAFLGNDVRCLVVSYSVQSSGSQVYLNVSIAAATSKVPAETALYGYKVEETGSSVVSPFGITLMIYVMVANDQTIYWRQMLFQDGKPRTITCYLNHYNVEEFPVFTAHVDGNYMFNGVQTPFAYGSQLRVIS
jgi:hypothetical protein